MKQSTLARIALAGTILVLLLVLSGLASRKAHAQAATDTAPATVHTTITPSDTVSLVSNGIPLCRAIVVTASGNLTMKDQQGNSVTYSSVPAYTILPFRPAFVMATGTTATVVCWRS